MTRVAWGLVVSVMVAAVGSAYPPPVKAPPEEPLPPATQADWQKSINNLKLIGVAVHNFHDANACFPADIKDKNGKALLSWRVALLPFLEQNDLFERFKLDEPWDGPTNKALLEKVPTAYKPVRTRGKPGLTYYQGFSGVDSMFDPTKGPIRIASVADGLSNTCLVVEGGTTMEWTKPADLPFDQNKDLPRLGGHFDGDFAMLLCDGTVIRVKRDFDARTMKSIITRNGGEVYTMDGVKK